MNAYVEYNKFKSFQRHLDSEVEDAMDEGCKAASRPVCIIQGGKLLTFELSADSYEALTALINGEIQELSLERHTKQLFCLDESFENIEGYCIAWRLWNGFEMPKFTRENVEKIFAIIGTEYCKWVNGVPTVLMDEDLWVSYEQELILDADGKDIEVYAIGSGVWCWDLDFSNVKAAIESLEEHDIRCTAISDAGKYSTMYTCENALGTRKLTRDEVISLAKEYEGEKR